MSLKHKSVCSLEETGFKRVCTDIVQHSVKYQTESDKENSGYLNFLRMFACKLPITLCHVGNQNYLQRSDNIAFMDCLNFVFNPHMKTIVIPPDMHLSKEMASVISTNCKDLQSLILQKQTLSSDFYPQFLKSKTNLVCLSLNDCTANSSFINFNLMRVIANSLVNLKSLSLCRTKATDNAMFTLCGHGIQCSVSVTTCSFLHNCEINSRLQLKFLNLKGARVGMVGVACVLTHIPTVECILADYSYGQPTSAVYLIAEKRKELGMPTLELQLQQLDRINYTYKLRQCLPSCPNLKTLRIALCDTMGKVLAENELEHLHTVIIDTTNSDQIFSENMKYFWEKNGPRIKTLSVTAESAGGFEVNSLDAVINVVALCTNLTSLNFKGFTLRALKKDCFKNFPTLRHLQEVSMEIHGDSFIVNVMVHHFFRVTPNIRDLRVRFAISDEIFTPSLLKQMLPNLRSLCVYEDKVTAKFLSLVQQENYLVSFFLADEDI